MVKQYKVLPGRYLEIAKVHWFPYIHICGVYFVEDEETRHAYIHRVLLSERLGEYLNGEPSGIMDEDPEVWTPNQRYCGVLIPISRK